MGSSDPEQSRGGRERERIEYIFSLAKLNYTISQSRSVLNIAKRYSLLDNQIRIFFEVLNGFEVTVNGVFHGIYRRTGG